MRRRHRCRLLLVAASLLFPAALQGHTGDTIYPIFELPTADLPNLHDQTLEDWDAVLPNSSLTHDDFVREGGVIEPENLAFRVLLAWHQKSQQIYMAMERLDDDYWVQSQGLTEPTFLYLDADHSGGVFAPNFGGLTESEYRRKTCAQAQRYAVSSAPRNPSFPVSVCGFADWAVRKPWVDAGVFQHGQAPNVSGFEIVVTAWDDLNSESAEASTRSVLQPNSIIGFVVDLWDVDRDALDLYSLSRVSHSATLHFSKAGAFVDGELVPCFVSDCSRARPSVVRRDSWARIKAGFGNN